VGSTSLTRDQTKAPCIGSTVLATGPSGKSLPFISARSFLKHKRKKKKETNKRAGGKRALLIPKPVHIHLRKFQNSVEKALLNHIINSQDTLNTYHNGNSIFSLECKGLENKDMIFFFILVSSVDTEESQ